MDAEELSFETTVSYDPTGIEGLYPWLLMAVVGGLSLAVMAATAMTRSIGLVLVVLGCAGYAGLLRVAPKPLPDSPPFRYFWLDQHGVHHVEGGPGGRTSHFAWDEIRSAEAAPLHDEFTGLILVLDRPGLRGVPIYLTMDRAGEAAAAIRSYLFPPPNE